MIRIATIESIDFLLIFATPTFGWPVVATGVDTKVKEIHVARLVRFHAFGGADVLEIEDVPTSEPGAGEVRIAVQAVGLNWADVLWRRKHYVEDAVLPSGLGNEAAGVIDAVGPGVQGFQVGDRVAVLPGAHQGRYPTYGDRILFPATHVAKHPANLSAAQAASAYMAFLTGYFALFEIARLQAGDSVLVTGASSGTGLAALQMARATGLTAIATTRTTAKRQTLLDAGAAHVVVTEEEDVLQRVLALTEGRGVDLVYDGVGGPLFNSLGEAVAHRGWYLLYGLSGGVDLTFPVAAQFRNSWHFHVYKVLEFTGSSSMGLPRNESAFERAMAFVHKGLSDGTLTVRIDRTFALPDVVSAHEYMERAGHAGKVVLIV
ncbi:zinc-dependent alcohol dehydrogenase family protein [Variovorax sp. J2P1-59]|uniref:zinc-dependent alcohol dehydrogenase family protein n=1 Tax=Variovorax flavidus TaxID=3053501 RepID=UPI0025765C66|nr:zinc-dependent alcohol dehydrogenase family protein [Variovorax sp. J2P1-59]MDM0078584.1 zinc-dependent alcohol dehydrogenase family protein [Variovorax sp. J2P1-59]